MKVEAGQTRMDYAWIDNVASWDYQGPGGWLYLNADSGGNYCPDFRLGDNVGMQPGYQRYPVSDGVTGQRAYTTSLTNNSYPQTSQSVGLSGDSNYLTNTYYKNLDGSAGGTVWEIPMATPISATRALSIVGTGPGADYVSPGYVA